MAQFRHSLDHTGECSNSGYNAEQNFKALLEALGDKVKESTLQGQYDGIDLHSVLLGTFDVKARKRVNRQGGAAQDKYIWVEFKNVAGKDGWLYGKSNYIAFERENDFVIVPRDELVSLCETVVDLNRRAASAKDAFKVGYQRKGRKDLISMISFEDLEHVRYIVLPK